GDVRPSFRVKLVFVVHNLFQHPNGTVSPKGMVAPQTVGEIKSLGKKEQSGLFWVNLFFYKKIKITYRTKVKIPIIHTSASAWEIYVSSVSISGAIYKGHPQRLKSLYSTMY